MNPPTSASTAPGTSGRTPTSPPSGDGRMELTIEQSDLAFAVGRALGSVSAKSPLPLLSCILLEADKSGLRVTGTDLDVTTSAFVPCSVKTQGKAAVSARHFHDVVRKLSKGPLSIAISDHQCEVRYGDGKGWSK